MANYSNELFDFAYSAERSIEDGIQELSDAEMSTVIISYVVMFVYITIALGKFKGFRSLLVSRGIFMNEFQIEILWREGFNKKLLDWKTFFSHSFN